MKTTLAALLVLLTGVCARADTGEFMVMSTRGFARTSVLNNSVGKEAITAYRFELPYGLAAGWRLPYLGFSEGAKGQVQLNGVVVAVPASNQPAQRVAITFGGQRTAQVAPNAVVESDPVGVAVKPGAVIIVYTYYRNQDAAGPLPFMTWGFVEDCDGCAVGDLGTLSMETLGDETLLTRKAAPVPLNAGGNALIRSYQPMFIAGQPHPSVKGPVLSVGFIGDSINIATGDFSRATPDDPFPARGWNGRACGAGTPYVVFGQSGANAGGFFSAQKTPVFTYIFGTGAGDAKVTCLVDGYGINELRQQTKTKAPGKVWQDRLKAAGIAQQLRLPYVQTTLTPMEAPYLVFDPTMGDRDARFAVFVTERKALNEEIRAQSKDIPGCVGFIDWGQALETDPAASDNHWQPGTAMEGIHPNTEGYTRMAKVAAETLKTLCPKLSHDPAAPLPIRVACVGDSLTSGFKMDKPQQDAYPAQLGRLLGEAYAVRGFAEPGRAALRKANLTLWKEPVFADAQAWRPQVVVICLGSNDCWPAIWQEHKAEFAGDLRDMVTLFANLPSKPHVYLCLPAPMFIDNEVQKSILADEVMPAIRGVAKDTGSGLIDFYTPLLSKVDLFQSDKVHPLPTGAAVMAGLVAKQLQR